MTRNTFRFGEWSIDPATNAVDNGTIRTQLEPKAMDVLMALCAQPASIVSAEQLLVACWGSNLYGDNPVHKTITQLRRALGDSSLAPRYIETIRKRGYRTIAQVVAGTEARGGSWLHDAPFRGLHAFDEQHQAIFFGRAHAIDALVEATWTQVRGGCAMVLVLGPSGSGKTSLIRAGALPRLVADAPGRQGGAGIACTLQLDCADLGDGTLLSALASVLLDAEADGQPLFPGDSAATLAQRLAAAPDTVLAQLRLAAPGVRICLFIDRLEAVFSQPGTDHASHAQFIGLLERIARCGSLLLVLACRNDFYPRLAAHPELMALKSRGGHYDLAAPNGAEIGQIVRNPVRAADLRFGVNPATGQPLDDILCDAARGSADPLPMLQYCLHELYRQRSDDGALDYAVFERLGGIEGAIGARAEQVVTGLAAHQRDALPRVLSLLVKVADDEAAVTSRHAAWSALHNAAAHELVKALVDARLFISDLHGDTPTFGIAHDALLRRWPRALEWIDSHRQALQVHTRISMQAQRWQGNARPRDLLLPAGSQANEARELLTVAEFSFSPDERDFIQSSLQRVRTRERLRLALLSVILILAALAAILGLTARYAQRAAEQHRTEAESLMGYMLGEFVDKLRPLGRLDLLDSVSARALSYLSDSGTVAASNATLTHRVKALQVISEVKIARADPAGAKTALLLGQAILKRQLEAAPNDLETLKSAGANAFWLGQIAFDQNNWFQAEAHFTDYRILADRMARVAPDDPDSWTEQSYAHNSLGSALLRHGAIDLAANEFALSLSLKERASARRPDSKDLAAGLADSLSWLAGAKEKQGDLSTAMQLYGRQGDIVAQLHRDDPKHAQWADGYAFALWHQGQLKLSLGQRSGALEDLRHAAALMRISMVQDPSNRLSQSNLLTIELQTIVNDSDLLPQQTLAALNEVRTKLIALSQLEPQKLNLLRLIAIAQYSAAELYLHQREPEQARLTLAPALATLARIHATAPSDDMIRESYADALLLSADMEKSTPSTPGGHPACRQVQSLFQESARNSRDFHMLAPWVLAHWCAGEPSKVSLQQKQLENMAYRESRYLNYLSNHTTPKSEL